jgi:hypothetical protein
MPLHSFGSQASKSVFKKAKRLAFLPLLCTSEVHFRRAPYAGSPTTLLSLKQRPLNQSGCCLLNADIEDSNLTDSVHLSHRALQLQFWEIDNFFCKTGAGSARYAQGLQVLYASRAVGRTRFLQKRYRFRISLRQDRLVVISSTFSSPLRKPSSRLAIAHNIKTTQLGGFYIVGDRGLGYKYFAIAKFRNPGSASLSLLSSGFAASALRVLYRPTKRKKTRATSVTRVSLCGR